MSESVKTIDLFDCKNQLAIKLFENSEYPWEILPKIKDYIKQLLEDGIVGYTMFCEGVLIGKDVKIYPNVTIEKGTIIGDGTEIRPGAFIRGNVLIGRNCVIGNSTEIKNSVLLDNVQVPHYNYVGDCVLGNKTHLGAGSICSNLKSDGKNVIVKGEIEYTTGLRKLGGILGDGADIGCGCILNPGTVIGKNTSVYPNTTLRGVYPENSIVKGQSTVVARQ